MTDQPEARPYPDCPLVVAYGMGVNSTALLVEFAKRGIRPDLILFADTGAENRETYQYLPVMQQFLANVSFPPVVTVRYEPKRATYRTLEEQCLATGTLPSIAYGGGTCAQKYKRHPQDRTILAAFPPAQMSPSRRVVRAIGFDAGEPRRAFARVVKAVGLDAGEEHRLTWARKAGDNHDRPSREQWLDANYFSYWYPLMAWRMDRRACEHVISDAGLPVPPKSACFYCPASKKPEILWLRDRHPELLARALRIEENAQAKLTSVKGLGRSYAWADYLAGIDDTPLFPGCT